MLKDTTGTYRKNAKIIDGLLLHPAVSGGSTRTTHGVCARSAIGRNLQKNAYGQQLCRREPQRIVFRTKPKGAQGAQGAPVIHYYRCAVG